MIRRCIVVLLGSAISTNACAASSVLVWPIFQTISASEKGSELWLENRGETAVNLQLRIFGWDQKESKDVYADQPALCQCATRPASTYPPDARFASRQRPGKIIPYRD